VTVREEHGSRTHLEVLGLVECPLTEAARELEKFTFPRKGGSGAAAGEYR
jgi:hypothetical protein